MRAFVLAALFAASAAEAEDLVFTADEADHVPGVIGGPFAPLPFLPGTSALISPVPLVGVRGQQPSATAWLYDGVRVPTLFHLVAGPPILPVGTTSGFRFNRSLTSARIRGASGGSVSVMGPPEGTLGLHDAVSLDLLNVSNTASWTSPNTGMCVHVGAGALWSPLLYTRALNRNLTADLYSYFGRFESIVGPGQVRLLVFGANDVFRQQSSTDLLGGGFGVHRIDARYRQMQGLGDVELGLTFGVDTVSARLGGAVTETAAFANVTSLAVRASRSDIPFGVALVSLGVDVDHRAASLEQRSVTRLPPVGDSDEGSDVRSAVGGQVAQASVLGGWGEVALGEPDFHWTFGARADAYSLGSGEQFFAFDPRLHVRKKFSEALALDVTVGLTHLPPTHLIPLPAADVAALRFGLQELVQSSAELHYRLRPDAEVSVSAFVNAVNRGVEMSPLDRTFLQTVKAAPGSAFAPEITTGQDAGLELLLRPFNAGEYFGWVSYSFLHSRRDVRVVTRNDFGEPAGTRSASVQPNWTQAHVAHLVLGRSFSGWTLSGALRLQAGAPEAGGLSSFTQRPGVDRLRPGPRWIEEDRDRVDTLQPFFRADLHVARAFTLGPWAMEAFVDVQNITFTREVSRYNYTEQYDSLEARALGDIRLVRTSGSSGVPALPLPMLGVKGRY